MSATQKQAEQYAAQIALLIQCGKLPTLAQVEAAILSTAAELAIFNQKTDGPNGGSQ